jgi:GPH family glycoside/pentoside/hexuronide:cation symporter
MLAGCAVLALATGLLFAPWVSSSLFLFIHLLVTYVLLNTGMTLLDLPHTSLSAELSRKATERNKLLAARMGFGILGLAIGSALPGLILATQASPESSEALITSREQAGWILGVLVMITGTVTTLCIRKRERTIAQPENQRIPSVSEIKQLFKDRPFIKLLIAGIVAAIARTINAALALMYYRFVLKLSEASVTQIVLPIFTLSIIFSIPVWVVISKRYGKQLPAAAAIGGLGIMGIIAYPILPEGMLWPVIIISVIGGFLSAAVFLVDSMITDIIDLDEQNSGRRKESLYFAVWKSGQKMARALAFVGVGFGLTVFNLDVSKASIAPQSQWIITLFFGIIVGLGFLMSGIVINRAKVPKPIENN